MLSPELGADMQRREFITLLGGAAVAWPLAARAQQARKLPTIGFLGAATPSVASQWVTAFEKRLRELGWIEGRTVAIEYRWAEARTERYSRDRGRVRPAQGRCHCHVGIRTSPRGKAGYNAHPDRVRCADGPGWRRRRREPGAARRQRYWPVDPADRYSLASVSNFCARLSAILAGWRSWPMPALPAPFWRCARFRPRPVRSASKSPHREIRQAEDIAPAIEALKSRADALYVATDPLVFTNRIRINTLALGARLPTIYGSREYVDAGALMSYGPNFPDLFRRAADYVDKILRGAKPADIPVEQPTKFELVINLKTAKALGLTVPPTLLTRADEVIE